MEATRTRATMKRVIKKIKAKDEGAGSQEDQGYSKHRDNHEDEA
jgi:hypothetical protein